MMNADTKCPNCTAYIGDWGAYKEHCPECGSALPMTPCANASYLIEKSKSNGERFAQTFTEIVHGLLGLAAIIAVVALISSGAGLVIILAIGFIASCFQDKS